MQTPDEWLADFEAKVADLQQKATDFKTTIESSGATQTSPDGSVTVTVAPSGALLDLHLTPEALTKTPTTLRDTILETTRSARHQAAQEVATAFTPLGGDSTTVQRIPLPPKEEPAKDTPTPTPTPNPHPDDDYDTSHVRREQDERW